MTGGGYRVTPGEPLEILAATWNDLMNLVEGPRSQTSSSAALGRNTPWSPRLVVEMLRPSDAAGAIGPRCPVILRFFDSGLPDTGAGTLPEDRDPHPRGGLSFAVSPTDPDAGTDPDVVAGYAVGITLAEIKPGAAGAVAIAGLVECTVNVTDIDHQFARLDAAEDTQLVSDVSGPCRIVWYATDPPATGSQTCRVLLNTGTGGSSPDPSFWAEITGDDAAAEPATLYSWKKKVLDDLTDLFVDADPAVAGTENLKRAPSNVPSPVAGVLPRIPSGQVVRVWPSITDDGFYECPAPGGMQTIDHNIEMNVWNPDTCIMTTTTSRVRITGRDLTIEVTELP